MNEAIFMRLDLMLFSCENALESAYHPMGIIPLGFNPMNQTSSKEKKSIGSKSYKFLRRSYESKEA
jgi:hypothetical protein